MQPGSHQPGATHPDSSQEDPRFDCTVEAYVWRGITDATGSVAGFRVREIIIGFSNDVTGRTGDVSGTVVVSGAAVSSES